MKVCQISKLYYYWRYVKVVSCTITEGVSKYYAVQYWKYVKVVSCTMTEGLLKYCVVLWLKVCESSTL